MSTKFIMLDKIKKIEERIAKQHVRGAGKDAVFLDNSQGWYVSFESCPASMYLGSTKPKLAAGDQVRLTLEKV